jgi:hypothetical protein
MQFTVLQELRLLWKAHQRVGLTGKMCLYSIEGTTPWPSKTSRLKFWFGPDEIDQAATFFIQHYNNGNFPYTPLLLNPIVHQQVSETEYTPLGSGILWATALGIKQVADDKLARIKSGGAAASYVARAENLHSGLKIVGFSPVPLAVDARGAAQGGEALYSLADIKGEEFWPYYLLSGATYPSNVGGYVTAPLAELFPGAEAETAEDAALDAILTAHTVQTKTIEEAATCWDRYDRHPTLYTRFGNNVAKLDENLKFYQYCARDFELFDAIGPASMKAVSKNEGFGFLVHGLIPRGSIVLLAGTGGTGKSSIAHKLCCLAATDWRDDEQPLWLGQPLNKELSKGICVYFSGEDGPAIINARNEIFDPEQRANRLMFQRNHFVSADGGEITFAEFLNRLRQMPEVPLLVVDPARKYLTGDEDDAAVVSEFFEAIERFAHERNTAVIVVHHLSKGAKPKSARDVLDELRGSQVFIDRPRVVIGMFREGPKTVVGLAKCNIPPSLGMVTVERVFAHNPKTLDLTQLPGKDGVRDPYQVAAEDEE